MILLLNPLQTRSIRTKAVKSNFGFGSDRRVYPPVDLCYLASCLRNNGFDIELIDANALEIDSCALEEIIARNKDNYEFAVIPTSQYDRYQCMHLEIGSQIETINMVGKYVKTIVIGPHGTCLPDYYANIIESNIFVRGESEKTVLDIVKGTPLKDIEGISYRENGVLKHNPERRLIENLDKIPIPSYELLPIEKYEWYYVEPSIIALFYVILKKLGLKKRRSKIFSTIVTSRGCPFKCVFCHHFYGFKNRTFSIERVKAEIDYLISLGVDELRFEDDTFTLDRKRCIEICNFLKGKKIPWACQTRPDNVNKELLRIMKESGCVHIAFGVESVEPHVLAAINKKIPLEKIEYIVKYASEIGIATQVNMLLGLPRETGKSLEMRKKFVLSTKPNVISAGITVPYPETELFERGREKGIIRDNSIEDIINASGIVDNEFTREDVINYLKEWQDFADRYNTLRWAEDSKIIYIVLKSSSILLGKKRFLKLARMFIQRYN